MSYLNLVIGAAIFDLSGLPKEYFTSASNTDISWIQAIFQALGLQSLLMSSLQLERFDYVIIHGTDSRAIVVKQKVGYTALIVGKTDQTTSLDFIRWAQDFEPTLLLSDPRFSNSQ